MIFIEAEWATLRKIKEMNLECKVFVTGYVMKMSFEG